MFTNKIFCTSKLLATILLDVESTSNQNFFLIKKLWFGPISFFIEESNYEDDEKEFYNSIIEEYRIQKILDGYDSCRVDFTKNNKSFLSEDRINERISDIFLLNEDKGFCDSITRNNGVFVISENSLDDLELLFHEANRSIEKGQLFSNSNPQIFDGWNSLFYKISTEDNYHFPSINSLIINDCYILENKESGVSNLKSLINGLFINNNAKNKQISIFTLNDKEKPRPKDYYESVLNSLEKTFANAEFEIFVHKHKEDLHGRFIITNYSFIQDPLERGFDLFKSNLARMNGAIDINNLYSDLFTANQSSQLRITKFIVKYIKILKKIRTRVLENEKNPILKDAKPGDVIRLPDMIYVSSKKTEFTEHTITNRLFEYYQS